MAEFTFECNICGIKDELICNIWCDQAQTDGSFTRVGLDALKRKGLARLERDLAYKKVLRRVQDNKAKVSVCLRAFPNAKRSDGNYDVGRYVWGAIRNICDVSAVTRAARTSEVAALLPEGKHLLEECLQAEGGAAILEQVPQHV